MLVRDAARDGCQREIKRRGPNARAGPKTPNRFAKEMRKPPIGPAKSAFFQNPCGSFGSRIARWVRDVLISLWQPSRAVAHEAENRNPLLVWDTSAERRA